MTVSENKTRVSIVIDKSDKKKLDDIAAKQERSVNFLINKALREWLDNQRTE